MGDEKTMKQQRIHLRIDAQSKQKLERAAAYEHKNVSEFVLGQALHVADEVIQKYETLALDQSDWALFLDVLEQPPQPVEKLKRAFANHAQRVQR